MILNNLIQRAKNIFPQGSSLSESDFRVVENNLNIVLPNDFLEINKMIRYDIIGGDDFLDFSATPNDWGGVIRNNLRLRENCSRDQKIRIDVSKVLLMSFEEYGCVFMITQSFSIKQTPVIACTYYDMYNYFVSGNFNATHDEWPSFTDFFEYLVEQEEKKLKENGE